MQRGYGRLLLTRAWKFFHEREVRVWLLATGLCLLALKKSRYPNRAVTTLMLVIEIRSHTF